MKRIVLAVFLFISLPTAVLAVDMPLTDIHGNTRFHDDLGTADTGTLGIHNAVSDMGASEFQGQTYRFRTKSFN